MLLRAERQLEGGPGSIELIEAVQLQIEHALDLLGAGLVLFLDASMALDAPFCFTRLAGARDPGFSTHQLSPAGLLHVFGQLGLAPAPPSYLLSVRGQAFALGAPMAPAALASLEAAWGLLARLLARAEVQAWDALLTPGGRHA